ncbi:GNAT family N-acetyltransferase [Chondromyces apiculatus]|uniref:GNAT family N-acetyltransferase n=1 Tax=Chondromyces apiculatus TaxID=51 RepID=UPI0009DFDDA1|nr:GNAT family N-acetyltransferase [Chondromyces apiculatus]
MTGAAGLPRPSSEILDFRPPSPVDLPHLVALQTDAATMRHYGGVQERANIERRLQRAIDHEQRFGYGLWSIYERQAGEFMGLGGFIRYNFDFDAETIEPVVCLKYEAQRRGHGRHIVERLHAWAHEAGLLHLTLGRVEVAHEHMAKLIASYEGHPRYPMIRSPADPEGRYLFYRLVPPSGA